MPEKSLVERTHNLLAESSLTWREISAGAGVSYYWLNKFACRQIKNPGAERVDKLHRFLSQNQAETAA